MTVKLASHVSLTHRSIYHITRAQCPAPQGQTEGWRCAHLGLRGPGNDSLLGGAGLEGERITQTNELVRRRALSPGLGDESLDWHCLYCYRFFSRERRLASTGEGHEYSTTRHLSIRLPQQFTSCLSPLPRLSPSRRPVIPPLADSCICCTARASTRSKAALNSSAAANWLQLLA
jgi:hypothetical protein